MLPRTPTVLAPIIAVLFSDSSGSSALCSCELILTSALDIINRAVNGEMKVVKEKKRKDAWLFKWRTYGLSVFNYDILTGIQ